MAVVNDVDEGVNQRVEDLMKIGEGSTRFRDERVQELKVKVGEEWLKEG